MDYFQIKFEIASNFLIKTNWPTTASFTDYYFSWQIKVSIKIWKRWIQTGVCRMDGAGEPMDLSQKTKSWSKRDFKRKAKFNWAFLSRWYTLNSLHVPRWCHKQIPEYRRIIKLTPRGNFIKIILKLYIVIGILKPCFNKSEAILQIREVTLNFKKMFVTLNPGVFHFVAEELAMDAFLLLGDFGLAGFLKGQVCTLLQRGNYESLISLELFKLYYFYQFLFFSNCPFIHF